MLSLLVNRGIATVDPYSIKEIAFAGISQSLINGNDNATGLTPVADQGLVPGESTAVLIYIGDSTGGNSVPFSYSVVSSKNHQMGLYNGAIYPMAGTMLGANVAPAGATHYGARLGDGLLASLLFDRVIGISCGIGGTIFSRFAVGGDLNHRIGVCARRLNDRGLLAADFVAVLLQMGPNDTNAGTSQGACEDAIESIAATFATEFARYVGSTVPFFVARRSRFAGSTGSAVRAAQLNVVNGTTIFAGPDNDGVSMTGDSTHDDATGVDEDAANWAAVIGASL